MQTVRSSAYIAAIVTLSGPGLGEENLRRELPPTAPPSGARSSGSVVPPQAIATSVGYPIGGSGPASVVLMLTITVEGTVSQAKVVAGDEPFASAALEASRLWAFEPAYVDGEARAADIRFLVRFEPPDTNASSNVENAPAASSTHSPHPPPQHPPADSNAPTLANGASDTATVPEVTISGQQLEQKAALSAQEVRTLPGAFGDAFRAIDVLPSVTPMVSGLPYFYIRGAPPGNTGYLFDDIEIPALYHVFAGPAVIHPTLVGSVELYAGAYPARLGSMTGGFVSGTAAEPRHERRAELSLRTVDTGALVETPFAGGRGNLILSGRYSYTGWLLSQLVDDTKLSYWDYQSKVTFDLNPENRLELLWFGSADFFAQRSHSGPEGSFGEMLEAPQEPQPFQTELDLRFHRVDLRWIRFLERGTWTTALTGGVDAVAVEDGAVQSTSHSLGARSLVSLSLDEATSWQGGILVTGERVDQYIEKGYFAPPEAPEVCGMGAITGAGPAGGSGNCGNLAPRYPTLGDDDYPLGIADRFDLNAALHTEWTRSIAPQIKLTAGLRTDVFLSGEDVAVGVDPRLRTRFKVSSNVALIHGIGVAHQMPSFPFIVPGGSPTLKGGLQRAVQHDTGVEWTLSESVQATVTGFQHLFFQFTDSRGVPLEGEELVRADGRAYGLETLVRKRFSDRWGGLFSYTISRSEWSRELYSGAAASDRTHVLNGGVSYEPTTSWLLGLRGVLYSGVPAFSAEPRPVRPRTEPFWRLDMRVEKSWEWSEQTTLRLVLEVLNTTLNEEMITLSCDEDDGGENLGAEDYGGCRPEFIGPVTVPNLALVATF